MRRLIEIVWVIAIAGVVIAAGQVPAWRAARRELAEFPASEMPIGIGGAITQNRDASWVTMLDAHFICPAKARPEGDVHTFVAATDTTGMGMIFVAFDSDPTCLQLATLKPRGVIRPAPPELLSRIHAAGFDPSPYRSPPRFVLWTDDNRDAATRRLHRAQGLIGLGLSLVPLAVLLRWLLRRRFR